MNSNKNTFLGIYILLVLIDLACGFEPFVHFRVFTKPLILSSLLVYFFIQTRRNNNTTFYLLLGALFCSLLGDVFLLFEERSSLFFTLGLGSFLLAHLLFVLSFVKKWNNKLSINFWVITIVLCSYGGILFYLLKDSLDSLKAPVLIYILGILAMVISAYGRKDNVSQTSFNLVFIGALFFVISDSVLAINKFMFAIPFSHILIMGTYATAQYLITRGMIKQLNCDN